ncbi:transglycosylase domain-containing protein [Parabacteroides sp. OttesenSCG-928-G07]|nr:transglycosylase domain-containing protein [Parabacteroides sp. OttesenSCG-928-G07]
MTSKLTKGIIITFWTLFIAVILLVVIIFSAISSGSIGYMPPVEQLENPIDKYASQTITSDGKVLGRYAFSMDNRISVNYEDLSPDLVKALIATEDIRFSSHSGIDVQGLFRVFVKRVLLMQKSAGGGSTITQQLAKQLYSPGAENILERALQKPIEWVIAVKLERLYTKEEIINLYLNKFDFLYNAVGIESAAYVYFGKTPKTLSIEEAATLIGMCKNPSLYNPVRYNERTQGRRNVVLEQMHKAKYLTREECDSLKTLPLTLHFNRMDHKDGLAPYFREYLRLTMTAKKPERSNYSIWQQGQKFIEDSIAWETNPLFGWCNKNRKPDGSHYDIYTDGLKIYTTIDSRMQEYAEESVREHFSQDLQPSFDREKKGRSYAPFSSDLRPGEVDTILIRAMQQTDRYRGLRSAGMSEQDIRKEFNTPVDMRVFTWNGARDTIMTPLDSIRYQKSFLRTGFMAMDPLTGQVKAYVGGIDYNYFQYDMITSGRRQVGSTMKPFVYSLAMIEGMTPCDEIMHVQPRLMDENGILWEPRNSTSERTGEKVTIQWALQRSSNWITAQIMSQLSPYTLVRLLRSFGLKNQQMDPVISICLGTPDVSVGEMVSAYTAFANKGIRVEPIYVTRIEDSFGNTVEAFSPQMNEVLTEDASYKMLHMLKSVVDGGSGSRLRFRYNLKAEIGGKTGTTQNNSDGWFMGFTPSLVGGVWVGGEERSIHFDRLTEGQGANMALPIYGLFMQKVYADTSLGYSEDEVFDIPEQFMNPCVEHSEEERREIVPDTGRIDRMFD